MSEATLRKRVVLYRIGGVGILVSPGCLASPWCQVPRPVSGAWFHGRENVNQSRMSPSTAEDLLDALFLSKLLAFANKLNFQPVFLATRDFDGITSTLACDANGDCADPNISILKLKGGEYNRIWP